MCRKLNRLELSWMDALFQAGFKGKEIPQNQIKTAKIVREEGYSIISIKFIIDDDKERFPNKVRVPVEMRAYQEKTAPIIFLIHVLDGVLDELEIFTADSSKLEQELINLQNVEYVVNKELVM